MRPLQTTSERQVPRCFHPLCGQPQLRIIHGIHGREVAQSGPQVAVSPEFWCQLFFHLEAPRIPRRHLASYLQYGTFLKLWRRLSLDTIIASLSRPSHPQPPNQPHISGFRRRKANTNAEDDTPVGADFSVLEYAIEGKILEAPVLELSYYADVVGVVPHQEHDTPLNPSDPFDIGNGDIPPEWGIDLVIRSGVLRYGPWADRQRWGYLLVAERR